MILISVWTTPRPGTQNKHIFYLPCDVIIRPAIYFIGIITDNNNYNYKMRAVHEDGIL